MMLYFAHAIPTYGTKDEARVLKWFGDKGLLDHLINPSDPKYQNHCCRSNMSYWKGLVEKCVALYFIRYKGKIPSGIGQEITAALASGSTVVEMIPCCDGFDLVTWKTVPEFLDYEATKRLIYPERYQKVES